MITEKLARFVAETRAGDIPRPALEIAKQGVTDLVGVTLAGSTSEIAAKMRTFAAAMSGKPEATILAADLSTSAYFAAMVNGTVGHALDYDDGGGFGHASVVLGPTVLGVGESIGASGANILAAYVIGFEVATRLFSAVGSSHYRQGWHSTATFGSFAAAAAAAWLFGLTADQVRMALGIAGSLAGGLRQNFGTMTKPLHAGNAAANGIMAAQLAHGGYTADVNIIEGPGGFATVFGHPDQVNWEQVSQDLGSFYSITAQDHRRLAFKLYPACGDTHAGIEAALHLRKEHRITPEAIAGIELGVNPRQKLVLVYHRPRTPLEAKFSLEYTVARALVSGEVRLKHFTNEAIDEPVVRELISKMSWVERYPEPRGGFIEDFGSKSVTIRLKDGMAYCREVAFDDGRFASPLTAEEFRFKFRDCAAARLAPAEAEKAFRLLANFDGLRNVDELMEIVGRGSEN